MAHFSYLWSIFSTFLSRFGHFHPTLSTFHQDLMLIFLYLISFSSISPAILVTFLNIYFVFLYPFSVFSSFDLSALHLVYCYSYFSPFFIHHTLYVCSMHPQKKWQLPFMLKLSLATSTLGSLYPVKWGKIQFPMTILISFVWSTHLQEFP